MFSRLFHILLFLTVFFYKRTSNMTSMAWTKKTIDQSQLEEESSQLGSPGHHDTNNTTWKEAGYTLYTLMKFSNITSGEHWNTLYTLLKFSNITYLVFTSWLDIMNSFYPVEHRIDCGHKTIRHLALPEEWIRLGIY